MNNLEINMLDWVLASAVLVATFILTGVLRDYTLKMGILDIPEKRSSHTVPTPRGGGLSFVLIISVALIYLFYSNDIEINVFLSLFGGGLLVAGIGLWDDYKHIPAQWRLIVHLIASVWAIYWLSSISWISSAENLMLLNLFVDVVAIIYLAWVLNLFNFMDGIDGIASVETICIGITAALFILFQMYNSGTGEVLSDQSSHGSIILLVILSLSVLGFLVWNWPPARIFMGDVGSGYLGFFLGVVTIYTAKNDILTIWVWLILMGAFLVDSTFTLVKRFISGERWYEAHRSHAYQHAAHRYGSHKKVTLAVLFINILWLGPLAGLTILAPKFEIIVTIIAYLPLIILATKLKAGSKYLV